MLAPRTGVAPYIMSKESWLGEKGFEEKGLGETGLGSGWWPYCAMLPFVNSTSTLSASSRLRP